jgi:hypothetical protein
MQTGTHCMNTGKVFMPCVLYTNGYVCDQNCDKILLTKIDTRVFISVHCSESSEFGSTFICWRHIWRDLANEYSWAKVPMISGYDSKWIYFIGVKYEIWTCSQLHQFGQIYYQMSISSKLFVIASGEANVYA